MQTTLLQKIFRADALVKAYFSALNTGERRKKQKVDDLENAVAKAAALLPKLLSATEEAKTAAIEEGHSLAAAFPTDIESWLDPADHPELRLEEAAAARSEIVALRKLFPMTEWATVIGDDGPDTDLYASKRKKFKAVGGILVAGVIVLAFVAPAAAIALGSITVYLTAKVYRRGSRRGYW